jgi:hypothetical protein
MRKKLAKIAKYTIATAEPDASLEGLTLKP